MSATFAFFRLVWRWATIFNLLIVVMLGVLAGVVEMAFTGGLEWWTRAREAGGPLTEADVDLASPTGHVLSLAVLLVPAGVGLMVSDPLQGLAYLPQSWTLPHRRRLFVPALVVGVIASLLVAALHVGEGGPMSFVVASSLALAAFAVGTLLWDTARPPVVVWTAPALLIAGLVAVDELGATAWTAPFAFALACGLVFVLVSESDARAKAMLPTKELSVSFRPAWSDGEWNPTRGSARSARRSWPVAHIGSSVRNWVRAAAYEQNGWRRAGGLVGGVVAVHCGLGFLTLIAFQDGFEAGGTLDTGLRFTHHVLFEIESTELLPHDEPPYYGIGLVVSAVLAVMCLGTPILLGRRRLYPLSRRQRAHVDWWAQLAQLVAGLVVLIGGFALASEALHRLGGFDVRGDGVPGYVRAALLGAAVLPLFQWAHLRWLREVRQTATACSLIAGVIVGAFVLVVGTANGMWREHLDGGPAWFQLGVLVALPVLAQLAYRARLTSWYARADLI